MYKREKLKGSLIEFIRQIFEGRILFVSSYQSTLQFLKNSIRVYSRVIHANSMIFMHSREIAKI